MKPTDAQLEVLAAQDDKTLAEWWCELNSWRWPEGLPNEQPAHLRMENHAHDQGWAVMCWIDAKIGAELISRTWNKDMPDEVFESFWRGERNDPNSPYAKYSKDKVERMMAAWREQEDAQLASEVVLEDILDAEEIG